MIGQDANQQIARGAEQRFWGAWYEDGLWEICFGAAWLLTAIWGLLAIGPRIVPVIVIGVAILAFAKLLYVGKARFVDRRTGYLRPAGLRRQPDAPKLLGWAALASIAYLALVGGIALAFPESRRWLTDVIYPIQFSTFWFAILARFTGRPRYLAAALVVPIAALVAVPAGLDEQRLVLTLFAAFGLLNVVNGAVSLRLYLKRHPMPASGSHTAGDDPPSASVVGTYSL